MGFRDLPHTRIMQSPYFELEESINFVLWLKDVEHGPKSLLNLLICTQIDISIYFLQIFALKFTRIFKSNCQKINYQKGDVEFGESRRWTIDKCKFFESVYAYWTKFIKNIENFVAFELFKKEFMSYFNTCMI